VGNGGVGFGPAAGWVIRDYILLSSRWCRGGHSDC
jgi:hypothetical protein